MSFDDWISVIDEAATLGCQGVQFIGGEPTLHPHFRRLIEHAASKRFSLIEVYTNATRLDARLIEFLSSHSVRIATSFYSTEASVHERVTKGKGSWERTVSGIEHVVAANIPIRVGIIETPFNRSGLDETVSFIKSLGVEDVGQDRQRQIGRGLLSGDAGDVQLESFSELCGQCADHRLCVTSSGDVFPCVFSRKSLLGNAKDGLLSLATGRRHSVFKEKLDTARKINAEPCYPNADCSPKTCSPQVQCNPNTWCSPDRSCQPQYISVDARAVAH